MNRTIILDACIQSFKKLSPKKQAENPIMLVVYIGAVMTTILFISSLFIEQTDSQIYILVITFILWLTVLFANFAEAIAEGRGRAQASSLKGARKEVLAKKLETRNDIETFTMIESNKLKKGDIVYVQAGDQIPMDGDVIEGAASIDESAITGESAPVIRESGGDRSAVTGGTTVVSDAIIVEITAEAGESFLDKMISMVEGAKRKKTPNEIALQILLITLTIIFLSVTIVLVPVSQFVSDNVQRGQGISLVNMIALLVCLAPTTIGALLSSIGIAGMSRLNVANVVAMSGRAIEAAGDVDILLLDKTGTITYGNRQAAEFIPVSNVTIQQLVEAAVKSSLADETAEGRSIISLAEKLYHYDIEQVNTNGMNYIEFSATTRMSGADYPDGYQVRKGAADTVKKHVEAAGKHFPEDCLAIVEKVAHLGGTPLVVAQNDDVLGVIYLKDIIKEGVKEKFAEMRVMGIKTIMITGDNPLTAAAIAAEAGVDDFLAEATPEAKLSMIKEYQTQGHLVAMTGDGTNDAPALAQADVAVAMNTGTQAAKEAGNMIDLDSSPTKLIEIVKIGKQLLMTRGALTTFSIANDIAKYFAIIPVLFITIFPNLGLLNIMQLKSPQTAILSAVTYNAIIIILLVPLALKGVKYTELSTNQLLRRNLLKYGVGGIILPFFAIKAIDLVMSLFF